MNDETLDFLTESNAIEGVYDTDSLQQAIYAWEYLEKQKELTIGVILKTHKILMLHSKLKPDEKGYFRKEDAKIGKLVPVGLYPDGKKIIFDFIETGKVMSFKKIRKELKSWLFCMKTIFKSSRQRHIEYEYIHPFIDGNGRTGRMFMNWHRLKLGLPILIIKESEKNEYYKWFK